MTCTNNKGESILLSSISYKPDNVMLGYMRDENNRLYRVRVLKKNIPNLNRPNIGCAQFARYFFLKGTVDWTQENCLIDCGTKVGFQFFYGHKAAAFLHGREKEGLFGFDIQGNFIRNFDENGKKHGPCADLYGHKNDVRVRTEYYTHGILGRQALEGEDDENYYGVIHCDGRKEWFKDGKLHRENDKPAVIRANGQQEWWIDGKLHRDNDQPAIIFRDRLEWWQQGVRKRDDDKPEMILKNGFTQDDRDARYLKENMPEMNQGFTDDSLNPIEADDIPTWVIHVCIEKETKIWFVDGKVGRLGDLPAVESELENGEFQKIWALDGQPYRENSELPTHVTHLGEIYMKNNQIHRIGGPAVIDRKNETKEWYFEGSLHRDDDLPAVESEKSNQWFQHGLCHRDNDKPALTCDLANVWFEHGKKQRKDGLPAIEAPTYKAWCENDVLHRDNDEPAVIYENGQKEWWFHGRRHRSYGPAIIVPSGHTEYWVNGKRHRDDGPAVIAAQTFQTKYCLLFINNDDSEFMQQVLIDKSSDRVDEWWENGQKIENAV